MVAASICFLVMVILGVFGDTANAGVIDNGPAYDTVQIHNNPGGSLMEFEEQIAWFNETGTHVEVSGYCASACTLYMQVDNVCFAEDTMLLFHAPFIETPYGRTIVFNDPEVLEKYPEAIQEFILANGGLTHQWVLTFAGRWANVIQVCGEEQPNVG